MNNLKGCKYVEPYAGGSSLALSLLFKEQVSEIHLNDLDLAIYAFWHSILTRTQDFIQALEETPVNVDEWLKQKAVYAKGRVAGLFDLGFASFYLNRTNHSGIFNGGVIGGKSQKGPWKIDARFNKVELIRRISRIGAYKNRIHLSRRDAVELLQDNDFDERTLTFLDPPYFKAGRRLYFNAYEPEDHVFVKNSVLGLTTPWIASYDDVSEIRALYANVRSRRIKLLHTARYAKTGREILFFSPRLRIPAKL